MLRIFMFALVAHLLPLPLCLAGEEKPKVDYTKVEEVIAAVRAAHKRLAGAMDSMSFKAERHRTDDPGSPEEMCTAAGLDYARTPDRQRLITSVIPLKPGKKLDTTVAPVQDGALVATPTVEVRLKRMGPGGEFEVQTVSQAPGSAGPSIQGEILVFERLLVMPPQILDLLDSPEREYGSCQPIKFNGEDAVELSGRMVKFPAAQAGRYKSARFTMVFAPKRDWCMLEYRSVGTYTNGTEFELVYSFQYTDDPSSPPIPKTISQRQTSYQLEGDKRVATKFDFITTLEFKEFSYNRPPDSAFEPAAFGLASFEKLP